LIQGAPGRSTYETPEGPHWSLYGEGDLAEFVEITLEAFRDPHLLSEAEYEQKTDAFRQEFRTAVAIGTRILGPPAFNDGVGRDGSPEDQDAVWLALWTSGNSRLMIEQKHEDRELPMRLCIVIAPPAWFPRLTALVFGESIRLAQEG